MGMVSDGVKEQLRHYGVEITKPIQAMIKALEYYEDEGGNVEEVHPGMTVQLYGAAIIDLGWAIEYGRK